MDNTHDCTDTEDVSAFLVHGLHDDLTLVSGREQSPATEAFCMETPVQYMGESRVSLSDSEPPVGSVIQHRGTSLHVPQTPRIV